METRPGTDRGAGYDPSVSSAPPEKASVVEDFLDIFHSPSSVYARRTNSGFGMQLLIVSIIAAAFAFASRGLMSQIFDVEFTRGAAKMMERNPQLTQDMINQGRGIQESIATFAGYVGTPVIIFIIAFFTWIVAKLFSTKVTYGQAVLIVTLAWIPRLLGSLVTTVQALLMDTSTVTSMFSLSLSPARFMDPDTTNPKVFGLMGSLEVFSIWCYVLIAIGLSVMGKVSRGKGYAIAGVLFVLGTLPLMFR
jgi:hypothetical protein